MQILPSRAPRAALTFTVAGDAVADAIDAAELLDVEMDQLDGSVALVSDDVGPGLEGAELAEAEAARDGADGGAWHAELPSDLRSGSRADGGDVRYG